MYLKVNTFSHFKKKSGQGAGGDRGMGLRDTKYYV